MTNVNKVIDFWKLCEIADFERFLIGKEKLKFFSYFKTIKPVKHTSDEFFSRDLKNNNTNIEYKTTDIYKVYYGLLDSKNTIKFVYDILKKNNHIANDLEDSLQNDLEKIKSNDYTYLAYGYVNDKFNPVSIDNVSLVVNPIFFMLFNIINNKNLNNEAYANLSEEIQDRYNDLLKIQNETSNVYIPDADYLLSIAKYGNEPLLLLLDNSKVFILSDVYNSLKAMKNDDATKIIENIDVFIENEDIAVEMMSIEKSSNEDKYKYMLRASSEIAVTYPADFIYLYTKNKLSISDSIPSNLYLITFLDRKKVYVTKMKHSTITLNTNEANKILNFLLDFFLIPERLIFKDKQSNEQIYIKEFKKINVSSVDTVLKKEMVSFYIDALNEIPKKLTHDYIKGKAEKKDVNASDDIRKEVNSLEKFKNTISRWSSENSLYYAQQNAVNNFLFNFNSGHNIFSVNGPPGTGKTTLLKDVIANIVTYKINKCIDVNFNILNDENELIDELCGKYEILVTSNNNAAVENITLELPRENEFDFNYLEADKNDFLLHDLLKEFHGFEAWSLIATRLGNSGNIKDFKSNYSTLIASIHKSSLLNDTYILKNKLKDFVKKFNTLKDDIQKDEKKFEELLKLDSIEVALNNSATKIEKQKNAIDILDINTSRSAKELEDVNTLHRDMKYKLSLKTKRLDIVKLEIEEFGFFKKLFKRTQYKDLVINKITISKSIVDYEEHIYQLDTTIKKKEKELEDNILKQKNANIQLSNMKSEYQKYEEYFKILEKINEARKKEYEICDNTFFSKDEKELQASSLYAKKSYMKNKASLFKLSMQINEVLFLLNIDSLSESIFFYLDNFKKLNLTDEELKKVRKGFSALFFVFPVVSTSLASSYTMLKHINEYGTLLCDESGQAAPQSLVGALNRANNAMIVGDPLQVEPVFTAPEILIKILANKYAIDDIHSPLVSSAQQLADNSNIYGSYYKVNNKKIWVGMPLVVHRRCVEPMFSISNEISYNNKMVLATPLIKEGDEINNLPVSSWIDVVSSSNDFKSNSSTKEIQEYFKFINKYDAYVNGKHFVISPFKSIYEVFETVEDHIGTVHTFQGKEADIVFLILGGNVDTGAKNWVSSKANILNVAATRAKKRFYIIGDFNKWKTHNYFKSTIKNLPILHEI